MLAIPLRARKERNAAYSPIRRWIRYGYIRLVRINDSPQRVATGLAVGVFLAIFPTFGLGILIALALAIAFKFNKASAILGCLIMNPITTPFFWTASSVLGALLARQDWQKILRMVHALSASLKWADLTSAAGWLMILEALRSGIYLFLLGNILLASCLAATSYFLAFRLTRAYRERKRLRLKAKVSGSK